MFTATHAFYWLHTDHNRKTVAEKQLHIFKWLADDISCKYTSHKTTLRVLIGAQFYCVCPYCFRLSFSAFFLSLLLLLLAINNFLIPQSRTLAKTKWSSVEVDIYLIAYCVRMIESFFISITPPISPAKCVSKASVKEKQ